MEKKVSLNISEDFKSFFWAPPKTGSMHAITIFSCLPFRFLECSYERNIIYRSENFPHHDHNLSLFQGHEDYDLISTARNPLTRLISIYQHQNRTNETSIMGFRKFFSEEYCKNPFGFFTSGINNLSRVPDYFIRIENMFEDYMKIPFISESKLAKSGLLEEICNKKKNASPNSLNPNECYTNDMIDFVYSNHKWYFDKLGYKPKI